MEAFMATRRPKSKQTNLRTLGGAKLQELRKAAGLSLLELAGKLESDLETSIDAAHINKIETGSIKKPQADTLEAILGGLAASYRERRDVLEAFGYTVPITLPTAPDIEGARRLVAHELNDSTYPVYLVDFGQRLWAWNRYVPRLIGLHPDDPALSRFVGVTLFDLAFNPALDTRLFIANPDDYLPAMLAFLKAGMYAFHEEEWYKELMAKARTFPGFSTLWDGLPEDTFQRYPSRSIVPMKVQVAGVGVLQFRMSSTDFLLDPRFQIGHFTPYGATTLRQCAIWAEEEGVL
jgi:transcriptional regulator with XRE-family HTH domain